MNLNLDTSTSQPLDLSLKKQDSTQTPHPGSGAPGTGSTTPQSHSALFDGLPQKPEGQATDGGRRTLTKSSNPSRMLTIERGHGADKAVQTQVQSRDMGTQTRLASGQDLDTPSTSCFTSEAVVSKLENPLKRPLDTNDTIASSDKPSASKKSRHREVIDTSDVTQRILGCGLYATRPNTQQELDDNARWVLNHLEALPGGTVIDLARINHADMVMVRDATGSGFTVRPRDGSSDTTTQPLHVQRVGTARFGSPMAISYGANLVDHTSPEAPQIFSTICHMINLDIS